MQSKAQTVAVINLLEQHTKLIEKQNLLKEELIKEETGSASGMHGRGPRWASIRNEFASTEFELKKLFEQLKSYGFDTSKIE